MRSEYSPRRKHLETNQPLSARKESRPSKLFENNKEGEQRFNDLFTKNSKGLRRYVKSVGGGNDVEDIVQETFMKVGAKIADGSLSPDVDLTGYLFIAAKNTSIKYNKAKSVRPVEVAEEAAYDISIPSHEPSVLDKIVVHSALEKIPPKMRETLFLTHYEGLNIPEIAERKSIPEGTVRSRRHHGIIAMKKELGKIGETGEE